MNIFFKGFKRFVRHIISYWSFKEYPNIAKTARVDESVRVRNPQNLYMAENTNIDEGGYIMNTRALVIFKKNSGAAFGFTAVTGNHMSIVGLNLKQINDDVKDKMDICHEMDKDIIIEEDVWIGNHVILLSGVCVGRGSEIGAGSVVRKNVPPYSIVIGNPCKVVGFRFTPQEIIEHEMEQYDEKDRLPLELLEKNYDKYYIHRLKEIRGFNRL